MSSESESGDQLTRELEWATLRSFNFEDDRPTLKHLNADSSWLLSLPYPHQSRAPLGRCRFNIVIDAWLKGPQVDLFSSFSSQEHATPSIFQTLSEVSDHLGEAERQVLDGSDESGKRRAFPKQKCFIDAVCCVHEFTDHCHEATLRELPSSVPVFAPRKAAAVVRSWKHFDTVVEIPVLGAAFDWKTTARTTMPDWIGLGRIHSKGDAPIYFHSALAIIFALQVHGEAEAIIYTPHGAAAESLRVVTTAEPKVKVLALLHGLHDISLVGAQLNMGIENALKARKVLQAKYWVPTHDEVKIGHGIVAPFLRRIEHTLRLAPGSHPISRREDVSEDQVEDSSLFELGNGESLVLK